MADHRETLTFAALTASGRLQIGDGYRAKLEELGDGGPLFLRAGALTDRGFVWDGLESFATRAPIESKRGLPADVVITTKGNSIGRVGWVPDDAPEFVYSPHLSYWRPLDRGRIVPRYLYYWSRSRDFARQLRNLAFGTDMAPYLSLRDQLKLRISLPGAVEQHAIADVLGALDDKITGNASTLVAVQALVDALYLRELKKGEYSSPLGAVTEFLNRLRIPLSSREREVRPGNIPYYGAAGRLDHVDRALFDEELVLVGEDGSVLTDDGTPVIQYIWGPAWVNNHAHVLRGAGMSTPLLHAALRQTNVAHLVTGAVQPKLSMGNLRKLPLRIPTSRSRLEARLGELAAMHRCIAEESGVLAATRDELLPALMSGKVTVRQAEKAVGEVV